MKAVKAKVWLREYAKGHYSILERSRTDRAAAFEGYVACTATIRPVAKKPTKKARKK